MYIKLSKMATDAAVPTSYKKSMINLTFLHLDPEWYGRDEYLLGTQQHNNSPILLSVSRLQYLPHLLIENSLLFRDAYSLVLFKHQFILSRLIAVHPQDPGYKLHWKESNAIKNLEL
jgi:hypothetical protein